MFEILAMFVAVVALWYLLVIWAAPLIDSISGGARR